MQDFLHTRAGQYTAYAASAVVLLLLGWLVVSATLGGSNARRSTDRIFIDARTGQQFGYRLSKNEMTPVPSPYSRGERVGYEAEPCYWKADGTFDSTPTWVLPKVKADPQAGPTFCHDCGRLVVPRNPEPYPGANPPPTQAQYKPPARRKAEQPEEYPEPDRPSQ